MIIFSTVFKILNKLKGNLILYTVILLAITLFNTTSGNMNHYEATKPDILIVNKDQNNEITKGFVSYLKEQAILKDMQATMEKIFTFQAMNSIIVEIMRIITEKDPKLAEQITKEMKTNQILLSNYAKIQQN